MKPITARTVLLAPIASLKPHPQNARAHSTEQIAQIGRSITEFGFTQPILTDENWIILAGQGRWLSAAVLGLSEVPVIVIDNLTDAQKRLYLIADNQLALNSTWDEAKLRAAVHQLESELADLDLTALRPQEIDRVVADLAPEEAWSGEDELPEVPVSVISIPGDLWVLGRHRVLCGDATLSESYQRVLQGALSDMVFCDLPYNCGYTQKRRNGRTRKILNDDLGASFSGFLDSVCVQLLSATRGALYLCMSSAELHTLYTAFTAAGGHWSTFVIWAKDGFTLGRSDMQRQFEAISYGWNEGQDHYWCGARDEGDCWFIPKPKANRLHPTAKPVALVERAIRNSSRRGDLVLDACGGSGSTLIASAKSGRRAAIIELDPQYVDVIIRRWEAYTQGEAHLESDERTFSQIARERSRVAA